MLARLIVMPQGITRSGWSMEEARAGARAPRRPRRAGCEERGCLSCHAVGERKRSAPAGKDCSVERPPRGGKTATADEEYLRESIVDPGAKVVKGFPNVMPTYKTTLSKETSTRWWNTLRRSSEAVRGVERMAEEIRSGEGTSPSVAGDRGRTRWITSGSA